MTPTYATHSTTLQRAGLALAAAACALLVAMFCTPTAQATTSSGTRSSWAPHINRTIIPVRSEAHGWQIATWYGPGFFGHRTACGGTLTTRSWGIAHRTLPCGTLVTLASHGRKVTVPVIDRGPYSGASVDLTSRTRNYLHFTSGRVRMTEVSRFRVLPLAGVPTAGTFTART